MLDTMGRNRDRIAGGLLFLVGAGAVFQSLQYRVGSLVAMGPGFFPLVLGTLLTGLGVLIAVAADDVREGGTWLETPVGPDWRGWLCITGGVLAFVLLAPPFGMFPSTFACVLISAQGDRTATLRKSLLLALCVSGFGVLLFSYGLRIPLPPIRW